MTSLLKRQTVERYINQESQKQYSEARNMEMTPVVYKLALECGDGSQ
jgi:hypothetical protein